MADGVLYEGNSALLAGPLGVVEVAFNGYSLGKTTGDTTLDVSQNIKDIIFQQSGTMPADKVRTGILYQLKATFGEISTGLLSQLISGFDATTQDPNSDGAVLTRSVYKSMRDNESAPLRVVSIGPDGTQSEEDSDIFNFYETIVNIDGTLINWGADTQRNIPVTFDIYWHKFADGESVKYKGAFGYYGDPIVADVPPVDWPDRIGPAIVSASAGVSTKVDLVMSEACAFVSGVTPENRFEVIVNGDYVNVTAVTIDTAPNDNRVSLTIGGTMASGDAVMVNMLPDVLQDNEPTPNHNTRAVDVAVVNNI